MNSSFLSKKLRLAMLLVTVPGVGFAENGVADGATHAIALDDSLWIEAMSNAGNGVAL